MAAKVWLLPESRGSGTAYRRCGERIDSASAFRRNFSYRRYSGSGRAGIDALRRARRCPRLRALPRDRARKRAQQKEMAAAEVAHVLNVLENGRKTQLDTSRLLRLIESCCEDLGDGVNAPMILKATLKDLYDGVPMDEVRRSLVLSARALIEKEPAYSYVTARLLLHNLRLEVLGEEALQQEMTDRYAEYFPEFIKRGIEAELLDERLAQFDLPRLAKALDASRDLKFGYLGLQNLYDRYFLHVREHALNCHRRFSCVWRWDWH